MSFLKRLLRRTLDAGVCFNVHEGTQLAAAIAYYLALSLFPLMLVLVAALSWAMRFTATGQSAQQQILATVSEQASPELSDEIARTLNSIENNAAAGGVVGAVVLLAAALALFTQIDYAFDKIWSDKDRPAVSWRRWILRLVFVRLKAIVMLMALGAFVIVVMIASLAWQGLEANLAPIAQLGPLAKGGMRPLIHMALNLAAFTALYRFLPRVRVGWRAALAGGLLAATLWELGRQLLAVFVVGDKLPTAYGLIGSFIAVMLWTYYAMVVLLFGAAFTRVTNEETRQPAGRPA